MINSVSNKTNYCITQENKIENIICEIGYEERQALLQYLNFIKILTINSSFNIDYQSVENFFIHYHFKENIINSFKNFFYFNEHQFIGKIISIINIIKNSYSFDDSENITKVIKSNFRLEFNNKKYYKYLFISLNGKFYNQRLDSIRISQLNYKNVNFNKAILEKTQFKNVTFSISSFINTNLEDSVLSAVTIKDSNLNYINLKDSKCDTFIINNSEILGGDFLGAKFNKILFDNLILADCNFTSQDINNSSFENTKFDHCNFNYNFCMNTSFKNCEFISIDFTHLDVRNCIFENCTFSDCNFTNAIFKNDTKLLNSNIISSNFEKTEFESCKISIKMPIIDDTFINSDNNIFTSINSISHKYKDLKDSLLIELLEYVKTQNSLDCYSDLLIKLEKYIYTSLHYLKNPTINSFVLEVLIPNKIKNGQKYPVIFYHSEMKIIFSLLKQNFKKYSKFNSFLNQLLFHSREKKLTLLSMFIMKKFKLDINILNFINQYINDEENIYYFFKYSIKKFKKTISLNVSHEYLQKFLYNKHFSQVERDNIYYLVNNNIQQKGKLNFKNIFTKYFKIFEKTYIFEMRNSPYKKFINLIFNDSIIEKKFLEIIHVSCSSSNKFKDWTSEEKNSLFQILDEFTINSHSNSIIITDEHYSNIINTLKINDINLIFQNLFILALIMLKCSSKSFFGDEQDSPYPLRAYALALINKCRSLEIEQPSNLFTFHDNTDWTRFLINYNHSNPNLNCSDTIANSCLQHCKENYNNTYIKLIPTNWQ